MTIFLHTCGTSNKVNEPNSSRCVINISLQEAYEINLGDWFIFLRHQLTTSKWKGQGPVQALSPICVTVITENMRTGVMLNNF